MREVLANIGIHKETGTKVGPDGCDKDGYNSNNFNRNGIHRETGTIYDEEGYSENGYNELGHNREGIFKKTGTLYGKDGFNRYGINEEGMDKSTGERNTFITLIEEYLAMEQSMQLFCLKRNIDINTFRQIIKQVLMMYPQITQEEIDARAQRSSEVYLYKRADVFKKLINGEIKIEDYVRDSKTTVKFEDLLFEAKTAEDRARLYEIVGTHMASAQMGMMDYFRLFVKGEYDNSTYSAVMGIRSTPGIFDEVMQKIKYIPELTSLVPNLYKERKRLEGYRRRETTLTSIGYTDSTTGEIVMIDITDAHIVAAKKHLRISGEYICGLTIEKVFRKIASGELTFEDIDKEEQGESSDLENLMREKGDKEDTLFRLQDEIKEAEAKVSKAEEMLSKNCIYCDDLQRNDEEMREDG